MQKILSVILDKIIATVAESLSRHAAEYIASSAFAVRITAAGCAALAVMAATPGLTPAQTVESEMDRDTLRTGDMFEYHVTLANRAAYDAVIYPDSASFGPDFIIRDTQTVPDNAGERRTYTLHFFGVDVDYVPEIPVRLVDGTDTLDATIPAQPFVYESRVDDAETALRPLKPIFPFFRNWLPWIIAAVILALAAAWVLYLYRERIFGQQKKPEPKPRQPKAEPFRSPLWRLRIELKRIEETHKEPVKNPVPYFTELGDAFRTYIEEVHGFPALESTTSELLTYLKSRGFDGEVIRFLRLILETADLVKFARFEPNESDCSDVMKYGSALVDRISLTDKERLEELRRKHEEEQQAKLQEEKKDDLG